MEALAGGGAIDGGRVGFGGVGVPLIIITHMLNTRGEWGRVDTTHELGPTSLRHRR